MTLERVSTEYGIELLLRDARVDEAAVAAFEARIGRPLPDEYRRILLAFNGGRPKPDGFRFALRRGPYTDSAVNWFYGLGSSPANDLDWNRDQVRLRMPPELLPIADDPGGNQICLGIDGDARGKVYFWDHEREGAGWTNVDLVADSFEAFLRGLA